MTKRKSEADLIEYLKEHLAYERQMLGFTFDEMHRFWTDHRMWNALFESFSLHARNLYDFLGSDGKNDTIRACDYVSARSPGADLKFSDIDVFVAHLGQKRLTKPKITLASIQEMGQWLDKNWARWCATLPPPYDALVDNSPICRVPSGAILTSPLSTSAASSSVSIVFTDVASKKGA